MESFEFRLLLIIGAIIGMIIAAYIGSLINMIVGKIMRMHLIKISLLIWEGRRSTPYEKFNWSRRNFALFPVVGMVKKRLSEKEDLIYTIVCAFTKIILFGSILLFYGLNFKDELEYYPVPNFIMGIIIGAFMFSMVYLGIFIYLMVKHADRRLMRINRVAIDRLWDGASFAELDIDPSYADDPKITRNIRAVHYSLCFAKAMETGDYESIGRVLQVVDGMLYINNTYVSPEIYTGNYYQILFYSTYINPNIQNAVKFYKVIENQLKTDMDPNGRRVLAFYQYYIMKNHTLAEETVREAENALAKCEDGFLCRAEIDIERKLITQLKRNMVYGQ